MIIKKVAVGNSMEAFVEEQFESGLNIISSDDNNKGKTIVIQSMMYAIGNEPTFPTTFEYKNYYYYVEFQVKEKIFKVVMGIILQLLMIKSSCFLIVYQN